MDNICVFVIGIARLCCDARRQVRGQALTYLQRALLVHDLQTLSAVEWEACFNKVPTYKLPNHYILETPKQALWQTVKTECSISSGSVLLR